MPASVAAWAIHGLLHDRVPSGVSCWPAHRGNVPVRAEGGRRAGTVSVRVHEDARHTFFFPGHDAYDKVAADTCWERVAALFRTELRHDNG
ncbi:dienelactone hydrolase family protein [Streptomyces sp. NPDC055961]